MKKLIFPAIFSLILLIIGVLTHLFPDQANVLILSFNQMFVAACLIGIVIILVKIVKSYYKNVVCAE